MPWEADDYTTESTIQQILGHSFTEHSTPSSAWFDNAKQFTSDQIQKLKWFSHDLHALATANKGQIHILVECHNWPLNK